MKSISIAIISFMLGATLAGLIGFIFIMTLGYEAVIGKLTDNVIFYRQIEQGKPELTQVAIESSLDWFINMAQDGENSIWISSSENDKQALIKAKALQTEIKLKKGNE